MSNRHREQLFMIAANKTMQILVSLMIGVNVLPKSTPETRVWPCATNQVLYCSTESSDLKFVLYIHLLPTTIISVVRVTRTQVFF